MDLVKFNKNGFGKQDFKLLKDGNIKASRIASVEEIEQYKQMFGNKKEFLKKQVNALRENLSLANSDVELFLASAKENLTSAIKKHEEELSWYEEHYIKIGAILEEVK